MQTARPRDWAVPLHNCLSSKVKRPPSLEMRASATVRVVRRSQGKPWKTHIDRKNQGKLAAQKKESRLCKDEIPSIRERNMGVMRNRGHRRHTRIHSAMPDQKCHIVVVSKAMRNEHRHHPSPRASNGDFKYM